MSSYRAPLAALPLARFMPAANTLPSPVSMPTKRAAPGTPEAEGSRKTMRTVTPKVRAALDRDDLGVGKSPARRLFTDESDSISPGISGVVLPSPPARLLAPSPPINDSPFYASPSAWTSASYSRGSNISTSPSRYVSEHENGAEIDIHDPGFEIYVDGARTHDFAGVGIGTPDSRRNMAAPPAALAPDATAYLPSSPASSISSRFDNQENVPPSMRSTPSQYYSAQSSPSKSGSSIWFEEDDFFVGGSGRRHGRSKLAQMIVGVGIETDGEGAEELTPGRRVLHGGKVTGKVRMAMEAEVA